METAVPGAADISEMEEGLLRKEEIRQVQEILRRLPDKYRIPLCLYYGEELSIEEIAACLQIPQGTVKSRLHKGREMMREELEAAGYDR